MPNDSFTVATFMWIAVGYCNVLLLCVVAPFLAFRILAGLVIAVRRKNVKPLLTAAILTVGAIIIGGSIWRLAVSTMGVPSTLESGMLTAASYLLPLTFAVVAITVTAPQLPALVRTGAAVATSRSTRPSTERVVGARRSSASKS